MTRKIRTDQNEGSILSPFSVFPRIFFQYFSPFLIPEEILDNDEDDSFLEVSTSTGAAVDNVIRIIDEIIGEKKKKKRNRKLGREKEKSRIIFFLSLLLISFLSRGKKIPEIFKQVRTQLRESSTRTRDALESSLETTQVNLEHMLASVHVMHAEAMVAIEQ